MNTCTETTYKPELTKEELLNLARILDTASFNFEKGAGDLLDKLVARRSLGLSHVDRGGGTDERPIQLMVAAVVEGVDPRPVRLNDRVERLGVLVDEPYSRHQSEQPGISWVEHPGGHLMRVQLIVNRLHEFIACPNDGRPLARVRRAPIAQFAARDRRRV